jgi:hypothetical protein
MHWGLPCSKEKVRICGDSQCCPQNSATTASSSCGNPPMPTIPTCDENLINNFKQDLDLNGSIQELLLSFRFSWVDIELGE